MFPSIKRVIAFAVFVFATGLPKGDGQSANSETAKPWITHLLIADVWPCGYSEVWLADYPVSARIVSNVDFSMFGPTVTFETADAVQNLIILGVIFTPYNVAVEQQIGDVDSRGMPSYWPSQLPVRSGDAAYVVLPNYNGSQPSSGGLAILDAVHRYYQSNQATLEAQALQRAVDEQRIEAQQAAARAAAKPMVGPAAYFKSVIYYPTPSPNPR